MWAVGIHSGSRTAHLWRLGVFLPISLTEASDKRFTQRRYRAVHAGSLALRSGTASLKHSCALAVAVIRCSAATWLWSLFSGQTDLR